MDRIAEPAAQTPAEALKVATAAALYAVTDMLNAARRAQDGEAIDAAEFAIDALLGAAMQMRDGRGVAAPVRAAGGNVVPFPVRKR